MGASAQQPVLRGAERKPPVAYLLSLPEGDPTMKHRPPDANQLGKLISDIAVGDAEDTESKSNRARGEHVRAAAMTPEHRKENAVKAASARRSRKVTADAAS